MIDEILGGLGFPSDARAGPPAAALKRAIIVCGLVLSLWTAFGLLSSVHFFFQARPDAGFVETANHVVVFYWGWALLTPIVVFFTYRITNAPQPIGNRAALLTALGIATAGTHAILHPVLIRLLGIESRVQINLSTVRGLVVRHGGGDLATFAVIVGGYLLFAATRRERNSAVAASALKGRLAQAELEILRWQLQPHFLFNALNTVSTLVLKGDGNSADRAIVLISLYLRQVLSQRPDATVSLREEMETVSRYLDVERLRFGDSLRLDEALEVSALDIRIPGLILQPLVENAVRHGVAHASEEASIRISATTKDGRVRIEVANPQHSSRNADTDEKAFGLETRLGGAARDQAGFGLRYVRQRLHQFYGVAASLDFFVADSEFTAILDLPIERLGTLVNQLNHPRSSIGSRQ